MALIRLPSCLSTPEVCKRVYLQRGPGRMPLPPFFAKLENPSKPFSAPLPLPKSLPPLPKSLPPLPKSLP